MVTSLISMGLAGIDAFLVSVEVDLSRNIPSFDVVGLPDAAVKESRDRVRSAMQNCGYPFPQGKIIVNLAPADTKKAGSVYDLPIFLGLMSCSGSLDVSFENMAFMGEISLSGEVRPVNGILSMVIEAKRQALKAVFIPYLNAAEGAAVDGIDVFAVKTVNEVMDYLKGKCKLTPAKNVRTSNDEIYFEPDFADVKGQAQAKRALEIAAAGGHNLLMLGSPGTGKSMLAKRLPSILPQMTFDEAVETTKVYSVSGLLPAGESLITTRPFKSPHHTISAAGLSGGGSMPKPGDISLAHNGVLFLDELPEFSSASLEVLRQPLEDGIVSISRVKSRLTYPSAVMLVAAMNPCPCGYFGHPTKKCTCTPQQVTKYLGKISGPLLDRIDIHVEVLPVDYEQLSSKQRAESSAEIKKRVTTVREIQNARYANKGITCNARLTPALLNECCPMTERANTLLKAAFNKMGFSGRAYDRILKLARTIADMDGCEVIDTPHISEAVQYRSLDRKYWSNT